MVHLTLDEIAGVAGPSEVLVSGTSTIWSKALGCGSRSARREA
jgi:hypothetical protein